MSEQEMRRPGGAGVGGGAEEAGEVPGPTMEDMVKQRIGAAVQGELERLEGYAKIHEDRGQTEALCHVIESTASIKARVEVYCIQVEMAAKTAAVASTLSAMARGGQQGTQVPTGDDGAPDTAALRELAMKARRPGVAKPNPDDQHERE